MRTEIIHFHTRITVECSLDGAAETIHGVGEHFDGCETTGIKIDKNNFDLFYLPYVIFLTSHLHPNNGEYLMLA